MRNCHDLVACAKDLIYVQQLLGHISTISTMICTNLVNFENDDFHSATAKTIEEGQKLVEAGFEHVCDFNDVRLFRKRK